MMDKNTLMLGNIVGRQFYNPNPQDPKLLIENCVVCSIGETYCNVSHFDKSRLKVKYEFLEPIGITEYWLKKLGFEYVREMIGFSDSEHAIFKRDIFWELHIFCSNDVDCNIDVKYVHQLQNVLFSLKTVQS